MGGCDFEFLYKGDFLPNTQGELIGGTKGIFYVSSRYVGRRFYIVFDKKHFCLASFICAYAWSRKMLLLRISFVQCLTYGIVTPGFSHAPSTLLSHMYSVHDSHVTKVPGESMYVKSTPIPANEGLYDANESESESYSTVI